MGLAAAQSASIPLGRGPEQSKTLLAQTSAAVAIPRPVDFSGIEDVSAIVDSAVAGNLLTIQELCLFKRTLRSARHLVEQLEEFSADNNISSERYYFEDQVNCILSESKWSLSYSSRVDKSSLVNLSSSARELNGACIFL